MSNTSRSWGRLITAASGRQLSALKPPLTPRLIFRALLGILLFICGIIAGVWHLIRSRREDRKA